MKLNKLIDKIGGRERLEQMSQCSDVTKLFAYEMRHMARALLSVLDAQSNPVAYAISDKEDREAGRLGKLSFTGVGSYSDEDVNEYELCDTPLYTVPPVSSAPNGWKMVPIEPHWSMIDAAIKHHEGEACLPVSLYKAMLAAAPAPENK